MVRMGYNAVAVPWRLAPLVDYAYTPHIFSEHQLGAVLATVDRLCEKGVSSHSDLVFPLVFRILIGCGTRITETLRIEKKDVDLGNGMLVLLNTKNGKQRLIPMAESLTRRCRLYARDSQLVPGIASSPWFFPNAQGVPYDAGSLYAFFRTALRLEGISHGGRGRGPRLHDLRHTFAVRVLNRWVREGKDLTTALPYLAIYMGHEGLKASQHYLRLTATMFPASGRVPSRRSTGGSSRRPTMAETDFARHVAGFLSRYLPGQRNLSTNTIASYRDAVKLFLLFCQTERKMKPDDIRIADISPDLLTSYLGWLEQERRCGVATRNQRLAAFKSFFHYVAAMEPEHLLACQRILGLPMKKLARRPDEFLLSGRTTSPAEPTGHGDTQRST